MYTCILTLAYQHTSMSLHDKSSLYACFTTTVCLLVPLPEKKSTVYCSAHFILLHILLFIFSSYFYLYLYIFSCVMLHILHCPLSGPGLTYFSLLIIFCIIEYVTNKKTLNLVLAFISYFMSLCSLVRQRVGEVCCI